MLRLLTLGSLMVHGPHGPISGAAAQPRRLAVLVLIARAGTRGTPRAKVVSLLWPDATEDQGRKAIAQAIYALRRDLGNDEAIVGTQLLQLNGDVAWCDLCEFEAALARGERERAVDLYAGPFLDGFRLSDSPEFERWADEERSAIEHRFHDALEALASSAEQRSAFEEAARWWRRRSSADPLNGRVAIAMMKSLAAAGDVGAALRHAGVFEALVAEELAMPADREVMALAESLRRMQSSPPAAPSPAPGLTRPSTVAVLPFSVLGAKVDPERARQWSDGLAEEILHALLDDRSLTVMGRTASFSLGSTPTLTALRDAGISHAVEGCVRPTASGMRVTMRIIETGAGHALWWDRVDVDDPGSHVASDRIAKQVSESMAAIRRSS